MIPVNRTVKIILSSGTILIVVWLGILAFGAASFNSKDTGTYYPSSKQPFYIKNEPEVEPKSPWRTVSLKELTIPQEAYESAKTFATKDSLTQETVNVKGVKTYVINVDPPVLKSNVTFVFLHGAAFTSMEWVHLGTLQLLGALGYRCRAIDLPGFGKTTTKLGTEKDTYMSKVEYFTLLSREMKLDKIIMVSPSMSGHYALPFVLTHPEIFSGIVPIAPAASGIVPPSRLRALQVPTMLIYGDRDQSLGTVSHKDLKKIPNFQAVVIEKAGHAAYLDQPDVFHNLLYNFAQKVEHPW